MTDNIDTTNTPEGDIPSQTLEDIAKARQEWLTSRDFSGVREAYTLLDDIPLDLIYTPADLPGYNYLDKLGFPGEFPFARGSYPAMYRRRPWLMNQYSGFGTADDTNARWKRLLASGQWSVNLAFDLPSHLGLDSDDPMAEDEVGRLGCAIDTLRDFEILFDGIDLATTPASFNTVGIAPIVIAMLIAVAEKQGLQASDVMGTITNDILSVYCSRGTWIYPPEHSMRLATDLIEYACRNMPRFNPLNAQPVYMRETGASTAQEGGYGLAFSLAYAESAMARGLSVDEVAPRLTIFFGASFRVFEEAAKIRAARRVWADTIKSRYSPNKKSSMGLRITGSSGGSGFIAEEPLTNVIRGTLGCLALVLGGVQGILLASYDEAYAIPTEEASKLGLRTQQIIYEESGCADVADPLGGSYYMEWLTDQMEEKIRHYLKEVENEGGALHAVSSGWLRSRMDPNIVKLQRQAEEGLLKIVGKNAYVENQQSEPDIEIFKVDPQSVSKQLERLSSTKRERNERDVNEALAKLRKQAQDPNTNLMPTLIEAVKTYATVGEISAVFKEEFGEWSEPAT